MKSAVSAITLFIVITLLAGCNMWAGLGKDVQQVGRKMEDAGERRR